MREKNIFYNVLRNETSLTEIFCNLLQYKVFRDLFLEMVNEKRKALGIEEFNLYAAKYQNFSTEVDLNSNDEEKNSKKGRADLIFAYRNEMEYIFELKIETYTNLTDNQPKSYLKYLQADSESKADQRLFFILPKGYLHKNEIVNIWEDTTKYSKKNIECQFLYWEDILDRIKKKELHRFNPYIHDFCAIMDYRWFYYEDIKFSQQEVELIKEEDKMTKNRKVPELMMKLLKIVDEVAGKLIVNNRIKEQTSTYYGYYLLKEYAENKIPKNWDVWFGVDYEMWKKGNSPLTVQINSDDLYEDEKIKKIDGIKEYLYEDNETTTNYFEFNIDELNDDENNIIKQFEKNICEVLKKIEKVHAN